jgi:hypothetical protein
LTENNFQTVEDVETEEKAAKEYLERLQRHRISLVFFAATKQLTLAEITVKLAAGLLFYFVIKLPWDVQYVNNTHFQLNKIHLI